MPDLHHTCSECPNLISTSAKTCSAKCRGKRSRRLKRSRERARTPKPDGIAAFQQLNEMDDVARDVMQQELRPVVREAITEDTLRAISDLVALAPAMVAALATDLVDPDPAVRQKAYTLGMRYTLGHGALVQPHDAQPNNAMTVVFKGMPRPDSVELAEEEVQEDRECQDCHQVMPVSEFVGLADRCHGCHSDLVSKAREIMDG